MNYKDKFNAQMKKAGINSLDDLKTDAEKKAFFKAVDKSHDAKNEELLAFAEEAINEFKLKDSDVEKLKQGVKQMPPMKGAKLGKPQKVKAVGEAKFTPAQVSALKDKYGKLGPGAEKNAVQMDKLAKMMSKYSKSHLSQLADMGVPMVSKVAKELMK
jgi:hypothetical protein